MTRCVLCAVNDRLRQLQRLDVDALENDDTAEESAKAPEKQEKGSEGAAPRDVTMGRSGDVMMLSAVQEEEKKKEEEGEDGAPQPPVRTRRGLVLSQSCCSTVMLVLPLLSQHGLRVMIVMCLRLWTQRQRLRRGRKRRVLLTVPMATSLRLQQRREVCAYVKSFADSNSFCSCGV